MPAIRSYSDTSSCSSNSSNSSGSSDSSHTSSSNASLSKLESLLRSGHGVDISVESPSTHADQRIHYMCTEDDLENEAQAWERYVEEYCFPVAVIEDCYGHIEEFAKLASLLFDARQSSIAGVCRVLSDIPVGHPLPPTGYHKTRLLKAFEVARRADNLLTCYARRVLRYKLKFPDGPVPTVNRIRRGIYLEPHIDDQDDIEDDFDNFAMVEPVPTSDRLAVTPPWHRKPSPSNLLNEQDDSHNEEGNSDEEYESGEGVFGGGEEGDLQEAEIEPEFQTSMVRESGEDEQETESELESEESLVGGEASGIARLRNGRPEDAVATKVTAPFEDWDEVIVPKGGPLERASEGSEQVDRAHSLGSRVGRRPSKATSKSGTAMKEPDFPGSEVGTRARPSRQALAVEVATRKRARSSGPMSTRKRRSSRAGRAATPLPDTAPIPDTGPDLSEVTFPIACPQPKCSVIINDMNDARSHWINHPLGQFRCPRCKNRVIKTAESLRRHVAVVHRLDLNAPVVVEQIELGNQRLTKVWRKALGLDVTGYYGIYRWDQ